MRATFYVTALLGLVGFQNVAAVNIQPSDDFDFAQTDAFCECEGEGEGKVETKTTGLTSADCFQEMNGVVIRLATPGCEAVPPPKPCPPKPCFEQEMLNALQELGAKSSMLQDALKQQFARNAALAAAKTMELSGTISIKPKVCPAPCPAPAPKPCPCAKPPAPEIKITATPVKQPCCDGGATPAPAPAPAKAPAAAPAAPKAPETKPAEAKPAEVKPAAAADEAKPAAAADEAKPLAAKVLPKPAAPTK